MFRKVIVLLIVSVFLFGSVYSESRDKRIIMEIVTDSNDDSTIALPSAATLYTKSFSLKTTDDMAVLFQATSATLSPDVSIYLEQSFERPTTEGSPDFEYINTQTIVSSRTDYRWGVATLSTLAPIPFGRFKIVGESSNPSDTIVQMRLGKQ